LNAVQIKFRIPVSWEEKKRRILRYVKLPWKIIFISVNPEKQNSTAFGI